MAEFRVDFGLDLSYGRHSLSSGRSDPALMAEDLLDGGEIALEIRAEEGDVIGIAAPHPLPVD